MYFKEVRKLNERHFQVGQFPSFWEKLFKKAKFLK